MKRLAFLTTLLIASSAQADTRCWHQPFVEGALVAGYRVEIAGMEVVIAPVSEDDGVTWCSEVPATGTYEMRLWVFGTTGDPIEAANSPKTYYRSEVSRADLNDNGAVDMGDLSKLLGLMGEGVE